MLGSLASLGPQSTSSASGVSFLIRQILSWFKLEIFKLQQQRKPKLDNTEKLNRNVNRGLR